MHFLSRICGVSLTNAHFSATMAKPKQNLPLLDKFTKNRILNDLYAKQQLIDPEKFNMICWLIHKRVSVIDMDVYKELLQNLTKWATIKHLDVTSEYAKKEFWDLTRFLSLDQVSFYLLLYSSASL